LNNEELRLSIEGSQIIGKVAKRNVLELDDDLAKKWMSGEDFEIKTELNGFVIIKNRVDFLGCGRVAKGKLFNYVPKERRV
jgi:NOL1/NOP2/fmu family ribosome biogenesis protein